MKYAEEPLKKEIGRMLFLAGNKLSTKKQVSEIKNTTAIVIKEDDEKEEGGLFSDFNAEMSKAEHDKNINTRGDKVELTTAMKLATVLNRIEIEDAQFLGAFIGWDSSTPGAEQNIAKGTTQSKWSVEKLAGTERKRTGSQEKSDIKPGFAPVTLPDVSPNMTPEQTKETAKWLSYNKNRFIISYAGNTLTPTGRAQIEFLARVLSNDPLKYKDEAKLLASKYKNSAQSNAYGILYDFYWHAMVPIMKDLGKRAKFTPYDTQIDIMMTDGLEHGLEQTVMGKYDVSSGNYGAWLMQTVKNKSIDYLRSITDFKFDSAFVADMLNAHKGTFEIASSLSPEKATGNFFDVVRDEDHTGYWKYMYKSGIDALGDFTRPSTVVDGVRKSSPLKSQYLLDASKYYKGFAKNLAGAQIDTEQPVEMDTELFKIAKLPEDAKKEVYSILQKVGAEIIANYKEYGIKNIASSLRVNNELFKDVMFALLNYGGLMEVYKNSFVAKNGSVYPAGSPVQKDKEGNIEQDSNGRTPETETVWTVKGKGEDAAMDDFAIRILEKAESKYGLPNLPTHFVKDPTDFIRKIYKSLRYYFGFRGLENPIVKSNRDNLNTIMQNYQQATLAEIRKIRMAIRKMLSESITKLPS